MRVLAAIFVALFFGGCAISVVPATRIQTSATVVLPDVTEPEPEPVTPPVAEPLPAEFKWYPSSNAGPWATDGSVELPSQGRSAPIVRVGIDRSGQMVIPRNASEVAWLEQGAFPSVTNNLILAGHVSYRGRKGAFHHLGELEIGDPIVTNMGGQTWQYVVTSKELVDKDTERAGEIMGPLPSQGITLITCGGTFSRKARTHLERWIVRGALIPEPGVATLDAA